MNSELRSTYVLGSDDQIVIRALEAEDISEKPVRVDSEGYIRLPLIGRLHAAGLTVEQLTAEVSKVLEAYIKHPQVSVNLTEYRSQPVSMLGAVRIPGVQQLQGRKTLVEIISLAGGLAPDAGYSVRIARRLEWGRIPLPNAHDDPTGKFSIASVRLKDVLEARNPEENILIEPQDVISVPTAEMVYVIGEVKKPGGFTLKDQETVSIMQAVALADGYSKTAQPKKAKILRPAKGGAERTEIAINLDQVLDGKAKDVTLLPNDILFVPDNLPKSMAMRGVEAAIGIGTGLAIYRR
ncbi:MAG: polysaccharide biosynthesis/export family protein [Acidobacteriota bacterium]|nr:polysaccharide biosynthesis/export family protein [Acidobacteriota bacterium]